MVEALHLKTILSAAAVYLFVVFAIRVFGKKELAQLTVTDLVFVLLISNAVQNAMVGSDDTLLGGILAATTLFALNKVFKLLVYKSEKFSRFMEGSPVVLVRHGKVVKKEMRRKKISYRELEQACRENGILDIEKIDLAILEVDGKLSIIRQEKGE